MNNDVFGPLGFMILMDWADVGAEVTLTLRSGVQLTGLVRKDRPADPDHPPRVVRLIGGHVMGSRQTVKHDVLMSEVVAITAKAR